MRRLFCFSILAVLLTAGMAAQPQPSVDATLFGRVHEAAGIDQETAELMFASADAAIFFPDLGSIRWFEQSGDSAPSTGLTSAMTNTASLADFRDDLDRVFPGFRSNRYGPWVQKLPSSGKPLDSVSREIALKSVASPEASTLVDSFENGLAQWTTADDTNGDYSFATTGCEAHTGIWSADAVRGGIRGQHLFCWDGYPAGVATQITHATCDGVQGASQAWLDFYLTSEMADNESVGVYYLGSDGYIWGYGFTGTWTGWFHVVLNLRQWNFIGDLTTQSCPHALFQFRSDNTTTMGAGPRIDDVTIRTDAPPYLHCSISASPVSGPAPLTVNFTPEVSGATGSETFEWRFDDAAKSTSSGRTAAFTYTAPGVYYPRLRVIDAGNVRAYANTKIEVTSAAACALGCTANAPSTSTVGSPAAFSATATPSNCSGDPAYNWNFGDGQSSTSRSTTHIYNTAGTYSWTLTSSVNGVSCTKSGAISVSTHAAPSRVRAVARGSAPPADLEVLVQPSSNAQTFSAGDLSVTIPGGLLTTPETLKITRSTNTPSPNFKGMGLGAAYDVTLGDLHEFDLPVMMKMRYDPAMLRPDLAVDRAISVAYFDTQQGVWVETPSKVNPSTHEILAGTTHLTKWGWFMWLRGYKVIETSQFTIVYDKAELDDPLLGPVYNAADSSNHVDPNTPDYVEDLVAYLGIAFHRYKSAGFKVPATPINVYVGGADPSQRGKFFGHGLTINLNSMNQPQLKMDTAHELFHSFEGAYLTAVGMGTGELPGIGWAPPVLSWSVWYIESAAEYAAEFVAWDGTLHEMGRKIRRDYLSYPLSDVHESHDYGYSTAHFLKFLVDRGANFKGMSEYLFNYDWWELNDYYFPLHEYLEKTFGSGNGLPRQYQAFARYYVFDANSPMPALEDSLHSEVAAYRSTLGVEPETVTFDLPAGYTSKLWGIWLSDYLFDPATPKIEYTVAVDGELPSKVEIDVYVLKGDKRMPGGGTPAGTLRAGTKSVKVEVEKGDGIYVLAVSSDSSSRQVKVRIGGNMPSRLSLGYTQYTMLCTGTDCGTCRIGDDGDFGEYVGPLIWTGNSFRYEEQSAVVTGELSADQRTLLWLKLSVGGFLENHWINLPIDVARSTPDTLVYAAAGEQARDNIVSTSDTFCGPQYSGIDFTKTVIVELWLAK